MYFLIRGVQGYKGLIEGGLVIKLSHNPLVAPGRVPPFGAMGHHIRWEDSFHKVEKWQVIKQRKEKTHTLLPQQPLSEACGFQARVYTYMWKAGRENLITAPQQPLENLWLLCGPCIPQFETDALSKQANSGYSLTSLCEYMVEVPSPAVPRKDLWL